MVILKLFFRFKVEGLDNLPQKTNFIVAANHASFLDPVLIGVAIPKKIDWVTLSDLYSVWWLICLMKITDTVPTGRASEKAIYLLVRDKNIGLFPEGRRSYGGKLGEFKRGAALLALKTGRPIVPCAILGSYEVLPRRAKFPRLFQPIKVKIGKPIFLLKEFDDEIDDIYMQEGIFRIKNSIQELIYAG